MKNIILFLSVAGAAALLSSCTAVVTEPAPATTTTVHSEHTVTKPAATTTTTTHSTGY